LGGTLTGPGPLADPADWPAGRVQALERWARIGLCVLLLGSWVVLVGYMWDALTTIPDADRLEETRMAVIPTPRTFFAAALFSALELGLVLVLLWPWWGRYYGVRLGAAALGLLTWFVITIPMGMSRMDWVHRRWLFFLVLATAAALLLHLAYRLARLLISRRT
jgi:hypothetical protein